MSRPIKRARSEDRSTDDAPKLEITSSPGKPDLSSISEASESSTSTDDSGSAVGPFTADGVLKPPYRDMVSELSDDAVRRILTRLTSTSVQAQTAVSAAYDEHLKALNTKVVNFNNLIDKAWDALYSAKYIAEEYAALEQFEASFEAFAEVESYIIAIDEKTLDESPYTIKLNALLALTTIAMTILGAPSLVGIQVREQFAEEPLLAQVISRVFESMSLEEQQSTAGINCEGDTLASKLRIMCKEANDYGFAGFRTLVGVLYPIIGPAPKRATQRGEDGLIEGRRLK